MKVSRLSRLILGISLIGTGVVSLVYGAPIYFWLILPGTVFICDAVKEY